ncbi:MAG: ribbon-helix-helix protein, CopG family [Pedobacter sp.]
MQQYQKQYRGEPQQKAKRRRDDSALTNVVSLRISDQEKRELEKITKSSARNISEIVREALEFWIAKRKRLCLDV